MAYIYCHECNAGQDNPDFRQCVSGIIECHNCGHANRIDDDERVEALIALEERITQLELLVNK